MEPTATKRTFTSCRRCKLRKIKCDAGMRACTPCVKANAECLDVTRTGQEVPRSVNVELAGRIIYLEGIIRTRCPDIDLSIGPGSQVMKELESDIAALNDQPLPFVSSQLEASPSFPSSHRNERLLSPNKRIRQDTSEPVRGPTSSIGQSTSPISSVPGEDLSHEVALVSLAGSSDRKYIGPSSGFSFAKLIGSTLSSSSLLQERALLEDGSATPSNLIRHDGIFRSQRLRSRLLDLSSVEPAMPPPSQAAVLVDVFFTYVHYQFPCLYAPHFYRDVEKLYEEKLDKKAVESMSDAEHSLVFQVVLVMAIALTVDPDRSTVDNTPAGLFGKAMRHLEHVIGNTSTLEKTQCLLLLAVYSLHSPSAPNAWTLSYHLMSNCVDLGLQRQVGSDASLSAIEIDLRKRIFWSAYTLDRILSVSLGRPVGLRDEGFDVAMPANVDDEQLGSPGFTLALVDPSAPTSMTPSIRLFEIMQMFTDIKLHLYRVKREQGRFPWPTDLEDFRRRTLAKLNAWRPLALSSTLRSSIRATLEMRYHQAVLLLYRPSPAFPICSSEPLKHCAAAARDSIRLFDSQQRAGRLPRTFLHLHETLLAGLTLLFCVLRGEADTIPRNRFAPELRAASSILAAMSETWMEARQARNVLDRLSDVVLSHDGATSSQSTATELQSGSTQASFGQAVQQLFGTTIVDSQLAANNSGLPTEDLSWLYGEPSQPFNFDNYLSPGTRTNTMSSSYAVGDVSTNSSLQALLDSMTDTHMEGWDIGGPWVPG